MYNVCGTHTHINRVGVNTFAPERYRLQPRPKSLSLAQPPSTSAACVQCAGERPVATPPRKEPPPLCSQSQSRFIAAGHLEFTQDLFAHSGGSRASQKALALLSSTLCFVNFLSPRAGLPSGISVETPLITSSFSVGCRCASRKRVHPPVSLRGHPLKALCAPKWFDFRLSYNPDAPSPPPPPFQ